MTCACGGGAMRVALVNIGTIVSGDLDEPFVAGDTIVTDGDRIVAVGTASASEVEACDVVIDAGRTTATPGLIDSHVHITFGDFTPRQQTVGYLESYVHGGVTTAISASEVHVPGRPRDAEGVKALAVAAQKCFEHYRPGGMRVYAGSVILEPTLNGNDLGEIAKKGVWLAKAGFGAFKTAFEYAPLVAAARAHGMITTCHTGGSSIPGSGAITGDHLLAMKPHVSFHVNGGPTAMPDRDFGRVIVEGDMALQVCTAATCAPRSCARRWLRATGRSIALSWPPTRQPEAASCRSACSTPCRISRASPASRPNCASPRRPAATRASTGSTPAY